MIFEMGIEDESGKRAYTFKITQRIAFDNAGQGKIEMWAGLTTVKGDRIMFQPLAHLIAHLILVPIPKEKPKPKPKPALYVVEIWTPRKWHELIRFSTRQNAQEFVDEVKHANAIAYMHIKEEPA